MSSKTSSLLATPADVSQSQLAIIDIGSNTVRLVVFEFTPEGGLRPTFEAKEVPRLGKDLLPDLSLSDEAIDRGVAALRRFSRLLDEFGAIRTVSVATSAVRDAPNAPAFLGRVATEAGFLPRVLGGDEEARYALLGVSGAFELHEDLVVDIGGGSMQAVSTLNGAARESVSLPLGALRLTEKYLKHDPPKPREIAELRDQVRAELKGVPEFSGRGPHRLFGVGGTIRSLARIAIEQRSYPVPQVQGYSLTEHDLESIEGLVENMPSQRRRSVPGISGHRADVIIAGLVLVEELLKVTGQPRLFVSGTGIREGVAFEALGANLPAPTEELAHRSVTSAARAFGLSLAHGDEVCRIAQGLFPLLGAERGEDAEVRAALAVAGWMHDVGSVIDVAHHPRHSAYLLRHFPILGLTHRGILLAALATALHEGDEAPASWRKEYRAVLPPDDIELVKQLGALLFFAETLVGTGVTYRLPHGEGPIHLILSAGVADPLKPRSVERLDRVFRQTILREVVVDSD